MSVIRSYLTCFAFAGLLLAASAMAQPPQKGTGYIPLTPAQRAVYQAADRAKHGARIAMLAQNQTLPLAFDARVRVPTPVGDQGQCGSCYLYSTVKTAFDAYILAGYGKPGKLVFSVQYGMDRPRDFGGCNGGNGTEVIDFMCKNGWIAETYEDGAGVTHNDYPPYEARTGSDRTKAGAKVWMKGTATWGFVNANGSPSVDEIKAAMYNYGRLNVALDAGGSFSNGTGTITSLGTNIDHEINVCAYDDAHDNGNGTKGAVLLENQWSADWGNGGYRWCSYTAAKKLVDWFWVSATPLPPIPPDPPPPTPPVPPPVPPAPTTGTYTMKTDASGVITFAPAKPAGLDDADRKVLDAVQDAINALKNKYPAPQQPVTPPVPPPMPPPEPSPAPTAAEIQQLQYEAALTLCRAGDQKPLLVFVGRPRCEVRGYRTVRYDAFPGVDAPAVMRTTSIDGYRNAWPVVCPT